MKPLRPLAAAATLALACVCAAPAQQTALEMSDATTPTCAATGVQRVAVMVPPGRTREEITATVAEGGLFAEGTQVLVLNLGEYTPMQNEAEFNRRMQGVLHRFLQEGIQIDGTMSVLLVVDESGAVTEVRLRTGNGDVDRLVRNLWRTVRFAPYAFGGCRMKAWVSVPLTVSSDWSLRRRSVEMRPAITP
jgi:hypothetical protein